jgi:hypothetical protein
VATINIAYSSPATVTITPASLADGGYRESTAIDNGTSVKYVDALVGGLVRIGAVAADGTIAIFAYGSYDGTEYTAGVSGTDGTITWGTTGRSGVDGYNNLPLLGVVSVDTTDDDDYVTWGPFSVAQAFGGVLPTKWGIVIRNSTGTGFHATQTSSECQYTGITYTSA